jgi:hypothetical protein
MKEVGESKDHEAQEQALRELSSQAPEIQQAVDLARQSAYSKEQLEAYDRYWDAVSTERTLITGKVHEARVAALAEGEQIGLQLGLELGLQKGEQLGLQKGEQIGLERGEQIGAAKAEARLQAEMREKQEATILRLIATGMSESEARRFVEG